MMGGHATLSTVSGAAGLTLVVIFFTPSPPPGLAPGLRPASSFLPAAVAPGRITGLGGSFAAADGAAALLVLAAPADHKPQ